MSLFPSSFLRPASQLLSRRHPGKACKVVKGTKKKKLSKGIQPKHGNHLQPPKHPYSPKPLSPPLLDHRLRRARRLLRLLGRVGLCGRQHELFLHLSNGLELVKLSAGFGVALVALSSVAVDSNTELPKRTREARKGQDELRKGGGAKEGSWGAGTLTLSRRGGRERRTFSTPRSALRTKFMAPSGAPAKYPTPSVAETIGGSQNRGRRTEEKRRSTRRRGLTRSDVERSLSEILVSLEGHDRGGSISGSLGSGCFAGGFFL